MLQKILATLCMFSICVWSLYAKVDYRDESKIETYKQYIETKASSVIWKKTISEKIDLLVKIQKIIDSYEASTSIDNSKKNLVNILYALEEYIEESMKQVTTLESTSSDIVIRIIDDKRCSNCQTDAIVSELKTLDFLDAATYIREDFSDKIAKEYMDENNIRKLPAIIFNTNDFDDNGQIQPYLNTLENGEYSLNIGANFDPYEKRSDRGFKVLDTEKVYEIIDNSFILGSDNAEILWLEYSDLECPFCARLHTSWVLTDLQEDYGNKLQYSLQHFPLDFHPNAMDAAKALECIGDIYGSKTYYDMIELSFDEMWNNDFSMETFYFLLDKQLAKKTEVISSCTEKTDTMTRVLWDKETGTQTFDISGTPWNVLINTKTGEYEILAGAYPYESFKEIIDRLLK